MNVVMTIHLQSTLDVNTQSIPGVWSKACQENLPSDVDEVEEVGGHT